MSAPDWHGWKIQDGLSLRIGKLPGREQVALYFEDKDSARIVPLAYFRSRDRAEDMMRLLDKWTYSEEKEPK